MRAGWGGHHGGACKLACSSGWLVWFVHLLLVVDGDLGSAVLWQEDGVSLLDGHWDEVSVGAAGAWAHGDNSSLVDLRTGGERAEADATGASK